MGNLIRFPLDNGDNKRLKRNVLPRSGMYICRPYIVIVQPETCASRPCEIKYTSVLILLVSQSKFQCVLFHQLFPFSKKKKNICKKTKIHLI